MPPERALLAGENPRDALHQMPVALSSNRLLELQALVMEIHCADALLDYVQALLQASRDPSLFLYGLSPRAGLAVVRALQRKFAMKCDQVFGHGDLQFDRQSFEGVRLSRLARRVCALEEAIEPPKPIEVKMGAEAAALAKDKVPSGG